MADPSQVRVHWFGARFEFQKRRRAQDGGYMQDKTAGNIKPSRTKRGKHPRKHPRQRGRREERTHTLLIVAVRRVSIRLGILAAAAKEAADLAHGERLARVDTRLDGGGLAGVGCWHGGGRVQGDGRLWEDGCTVSEGGSVRCSERASCRWMLKSASSSITVQQ